DAIPCASPDVCVSGTCAPAQPAGASCPTGGECDIAQGAICEPTTHKCVMVTFAGAGQACGLVGGAIVGCKGGGTCKVTAGMTQGTCQPAAADGAACDVTNGPHCLPPATCDKGLCRLPDTSCP